MKEDPTVIPIYKTKLFCEFFESSQDFLDSWKESEFYTLTLDSSFNPIIPDNDVKLAFGLLLARYANSPIANMSEEQFIIKLWQTIFQYGPSWSKRLEVQRKLRALTDDEIVQGAKIINNHAYNPSTTPGTDSLTELNYINEQTSQNYKKAKIDAYANLWELLRADVTEQFVKKFQKLFKQVVTPERTYIYVTDLEGEEE